MSNTTSITSLIAKLEALNTSSIEPNQTDEYYKYLGSNFRNFCSFSESLKTAAFSSDSKYLVSKMLEDVLIFMEMFQNEPKFVEAKSHLLKGEFDAAEEKLDGLSIDKPYFTGLVKKASYDVWSHQQANEYQATFPSLNILIDTALLIQKS
jgi:hypothetical protein